MSVQHCDRLRVHDSAHLRGVESENLHPSEGCDLWIDYAWPFRHGLFSGANGYLPKLRNVGRSDV